MEFQHLNLSVRTKCPLYSTKDLMTEMATFFFFCVCSWLINFGDIRCSYHHTACQLKLSFGAKGENVCLLLCLSRVGCGVTHMAGVVCAAGLTDINVSSMGIILTEELQCCNTCSVLNAQLELQYEEKRTE